MRECPCYNTINNSLGQNELESRIPFPLEVIKIITEEVCHRLAAMD